MVLEVSNFTDSSIVETVLRSIFLGLPAFAGFILNAILIVLVSQSNSIRGLPINRLVLSLTALNILDALFNVSIQLSTSITSSWDFGGDYLCRATVTLFQLADTYLIFNLVLLAADRLIAVKFARSYERVLNFPRILVVLLLTAALSVCVALPVLLVPQIPAYLYPNRYTCSFGYNSTPIYVLIALVLCYVLPILLLIVLYSWIFRLVLLTRRTHSLANCAPNARASRRRAHHSRHRHHRRHHHYRQHSRPRYVTRGRDQSAIWVQLHGAKYSGILTVGWCVLVLPYLSYVYFERLLHSFEMELVLTHYAELTLVTMRAWYGLVLPILTFVWRADFNLRLRALCCCCWCCISDVDDGDPDFWPAYLRKSRRHHRLRSRERDRRRARGGDLEGVDNRGADATGVGADGEGAGPAGLTSPGATSSENEPEGTHGSANASISSVGPGAASAVVGSLSTAPNSIAARGGVGSAVGSPFTVSSISLNVPVLYANEEGIHLKTSITMPSSSAGRSLGQTQLSSLNANQLLNNLDFDHTHPQATLHSQHSGGSTVVRTRVSMKCDIAANETETEDEDEDEEEEVDEADIAYEAEEGERGPQDEQEPRGRGRGETEGRESGALPGHANSAFEADDSQAVLQTRALNGPHAAVVSGPLSAIAAANARSYAGSISPTATAHSSSAVFVHSQAIRVAPDTAFDRSTCARLDPLLELREAGGGGDRRAPDVFARAETMATDGTSRSLRTSVTTLELELERSPAPAAAATSITSAANSAAALREGSPHRLHQQHSHQHHRRRRHQKRLESAVPEETGLTSHQPDSGRSETCVVIESSNAGDGVSGQNPNQNQNQMEIQRERRRRKREGSWTREDSGPEAGRGSTVRGTGSPEDQKPSGKKRQRSRSRHHRRQRSSETGAAPALEEHEERESRVMGSRAGAPAPGPGGALALAPIEPSSPDQLAPLEHEMADGAEAEPDELQASAGSNAPLRLHMQPPPLERPARPIRAPDADS